MRERRERQREGADRAGRFPIQEAETAKVFILYDIYMLNCDIYNCDEMMMSLVFFNIGMILIFLKIG